MIIPFGQMLESITLHFYGYLEVFNAFELAIGDYTEYNNANSLYALGSVVTSLLFLKLAIVKIKLWNKRRALAPVSSLGKRSLQEITKLRDLVVEIHYAACYCASNPEMVGRCKLLLRVYPAACDIHMHGHNYTPFLRACWNGCAELIAFMIRLGANHSAVTDAGEGAVYLVTYFLVRKKSNDFLALTVLIQAGVDINHARNDGLTALDLAALRGHSRLAQWLVAKGASPTPQEDLSMIMEWKKR